MVINNLLGLWHVVQSNFSYHKYIELKPLQEFLFNKNDPLCIHDELNL
jgi:hypothetical protein